MPIARKIRHLMWRKISAYDRTRCHCISGIIITLLMTPFAGAAKGESPEEVIVNATRITKDAFNLPVAIGVVNQEQIQQAQQQLGLDESLTRIPGIFLQNRYNFAQDIRVSIRGSGARGSFGVRGVKILVDGIPNTLPDGQGQFDSVDIGSIGQIDVLRGASSSLYGNASGGVINITTEPAPEKPYLEARTAFGEYGYAKSQIKTAGKSGRLDYLLSASYLELDGYREQSRAENKNFNGRIRVQMDDSSDLITLINVFDSPISEDPGGINAAAVKADPRQARNLNVLFDAGETIEQQKLGFKYRKSLDDEQEIIARVYRLWRDFEGSLPFFDGGIVQFDRLFFGGGLQYTNTSVLWGRNNRVTIGIDYDLQEDDRQRYNNKNGAKQALVFDQQEEVASLGVFVQNELALTDSLELTAGIRYDEISFDVDDKFFADGDDSGQRDLDSINASLSLLWRLDERLNVYTNIATSFETPTTTEFANPMGGGFNQALNPQETINYEVGMKGRSATNRFNYDLALFSINIEDELTPFELTQSPGRTFFENAGKSHRHGVELAVGAQLLKGLDAAVAYTYSDFEFDRFNDANGTRFDGNQIPGIPKQLLHVSLTYRHQAGFFAEADTLFVGRFYANNANTTETNSYWSANLRMGWQFRLDSVELTPFVGINNLFDKNYSSNVRINAFGGRYFEPAPAQNAYGGLLVKINL